MKTKLFILLSVITFYWYCTPSVYAQNDEATESAATELNTAFKNMHTTAVFKKMNLPCKIESIAENYALYFNESTFFVTMNYVQKSIEAINNNENIVDKAGFSTKFDRLFEMFDKSMTYMTFVQTFSIRDFSDLTKEEEEALKYAYHLLKAIHNDASLLKHYEDPAETGGCDDSIDYRIRIIQKNNLGQVTWEIKTVVDIDCDCEKKYKKYDLEYLKFEYSAEVTGIFTASKKTFSAPKNPTLKIVRYQCCIEKEQTKEPTETALNDGKGIDDLMQNQTLGFGAGIGFAQDFEETSFCVSAEYLYQLNSDEYNGWYAGAEATYQNTSFGDYSSHKFVAGGKLQYNFSAIPSGETQFVAGLMANYAFGNNDNNGFKDDFTGLIGCLYSGINVRLSEDWSIGGQFPIFIYENFTYKPENGGEFKIDGTSLFINKDNPLKIILRHRF